MTHLKLNHLTAQVVVRIALLTGLTGLAGLAGCKSAADKCRAENQEIFAKAVAACKDDACKNAAALDLKKYLAACDDMK